MDTIIMMISKVASIYSSLVTVTSVFSTVVIMLFKDLNIALEKGNGDAKIAQDQENEPSYLYFLPLIFHRHF